MRFETMAIHIGEEPDLKGTGDVVIPIHLSATFAKKDIFTQGAYEYSRTGNPTRHALEKRLASLEGAKFALAFSSGMAAETVLAITLLKPGDHVIAFDDLYGGTKRLFNRVFADGYGIEFSYVNMTDANVVKSAFKSNTKLVWIETPTNPLLRLCDIKLMSEMAKEHNALVVVDNTFMSPYFQKPLQLGADIVIHSTTKYLNGHSDSVGGAIMLSDEGIFEKLKFNQNATGAILSPFDSFLVLRGLKTLPIRMKKHEENAIKIAEFLEKHPGVRKVYYPGLKTNPQYDLAKRQMSGFGGMLSFELTGGIEKVKVFLERLKIFTLAESLGGVESLIEHPASMTHGSLPKEEREKSGITDSLIRISVGIENTEDLLEDIATALRG